MSKYFGNKKAQQESERLRRRHRRRLNRLKVLYRLKAEIEKRRMAARMAQDFTDSIIFPEQQVVSHDLYAMIDAAIEAEKKKESE